MLLTHSGERGVKSDAIVVAYRSTEVIQRCVEGLRSDPSIDRIVIVNNSSGDGTASAVEAMDGLIYLETPANLGYGSAVNLARSSIAAPYVVLANPDAVQDATTTTMLLRFGSAHPRCAVVAPRMTTSKGLIDRNSQYDLSLVRMTFQAIGWPERLQLMRTRAEHLMEHRTDCVVGHSFFVKWRRLMRSAGSMSPYSFLAKTRIFVNASEPRVGISGSLRSDEFDIPTDTHGDSCLIKVRRLFRLARYRELKKARGPIEAQAYRALVGARVTRC